MSMSDFSDPGLQIINDLDYTLCKNHDLKMKTQSSKFFADFFVPILRVSRAPLLTNKNLKICFPCVQNHCDFVENDIGEFLEYVDVVWCD